jgi:YegS/Rv2252/BmrU family lipid kinase
LREKKEEKSSSMDSAASRKNEQGQSKEKVLIIANPSSSGGSTGNDWENLQMKLEQAFGENALEIVFTKKAGDGAILTREFLRKGFRKVVAMGGDGTINEVANGFFFAEEKKDARVGSNVDRDKIDFEIPNPSILKPINSEAIMGLIPSGTRNVLAKSLGLPEGLMECCYNFVNGKIQKLDVITATVTDPTDYSIATTRAFLNAAEIGFGAEVIDRSKKVREKVNSRLISTVTSVIATLPTYESNICEIEFDNGREKVVTKMTMGVIANGKFLGGGFMVAPEASFSDGLLDIVILRDSGSLKMLDKLANMRIGEYVDEVDMLYKQVKKVSIKSKERDVTVAIDGEPIGILPATFQVNQHALNVLL